MNTIIRSRIYLLMAAMILTAALVVPAAAERHLSGTIQGREGDVFQGPPPGTLSVDGNATGIATHLGQFTMTWRATVNLADASGTGSFHFISANGDSLYATDVGQAEPTDTPGLMRIVEINTITGGTGRFEGAKGSFTLERSLDVTTGVTSGSFHGTIASPGAPH